MLKRFLAELVGTFWLVLGGTGTAVLAGQHVGFQGVALAFGLTVVTGAYALGRISGGHFNPAVTLGLVAAGRTPVSDLVPYVIAQAVGAIIASGVVYLIASGIPGGYDLAKGLAANGFGDHSPDKYSMMAGLITEVVLTAVFLVMIVGVTSSSTTAAFAPLAIGLTLTLIHLISIPVTNTSVNPARSLGPAVFVGGWALEQLWLFIVAPLVGGFIGGVIGRFLTEPETSVAAAPTAPGAPAE